MKNRNLIKLLGIFMFTVSMLMSCSSDDDNTPNNPDTSSIYDKWWYDTNDFTADIYFHSNGDYEQKIILFGTELTSTGDWTWEDESAGIMKIDNLSGQGQAASFAWIKFSDVLDNTMTVQQSANGTDYSIEVFYADTEN